VLGAALLAGVGLFSIPARADDDVRLRLNWMYYGSHAGFALG
jgi:NitT/TauT family transport system substrate-binding protein